MPPHVEGVVVGLPRTHQRHLGEGGFAPGAGRCGRRLLAELKLRPLHGDLALHGGETTADRAHLSVEGDDRLHKVSILRLQQHI